MKEKFRAFIEEAKIGLDHALLGSMPSDKQIAMRNGFNPTIASLASAMAELMIGFSLLFMLLNGVFTKYFLLSSSPFSFGVKAILLSIAFEGLYRVFSIVLGKKQSAGSVFYTSLEILSAGISRVFMMLRSKASNNLFRKKLDQKTPEEKKQKEIAKNFKKFIEYGMDQSAAGYSRQ